MTIDDLVEKLGGKVATAYLAKASLPSVYKWIQEDRVFQAAHAVRLVRAAAALGIEITVAELARVPEANGSTEPPRRARKPRWFSGSDGNSRSATKRSADGGEAPAVGRVKARYARAA